MQLVKKEGKFLSMAMKGRESEKRKSSNGIGQPTTKAEL